MRYNATQYAKALFDVTQDVEHDAEVDQAFAAFIEMLQKDEAEHLLGAILKAYKTILLKKNLLPEATVTSAEALSQETVEHIRNVCGLAEGTSLKQHIAPEMIGGVRVKENNRYFDLSLERKMSRLREVLQQNI